MFELLNNISVRAKMIVNTSVLMLIIISLYSFTSITQISVSNK